MYPFNVARPARAGITCGILGLLRLGLPSMSPAQLGRELPGIADADGETLGPSMSPAQLGRELRQVGVWCDSGRIPSMSPAQLGRELHDIRLAPLAGKHLQCRPPSSGGNYLHGVVQGPAWHQPSMSPAQLGRELPVSITAVAACASLQCRPPSSGGNYAQARACRCRRSRSFNVARPARAGITTSWLSSRPARIDLQCRPPSSGGNYSAARRNAGRGAHLQCRPPSSGGNYMRLGSAGPLPSMSPPTAGNVRAAI